ncbi:response regulator transcription factor [Lysinibacillus xylanilyticus]|uniref:response regulator transcription factor n=1 Tax=Lysinibacillus xylanilyticus TaxID=582475 RepID=UPI003D047065
MHYIVSKSFPLPTDYIEKLTDSEKQILQLLCDGYKRKEIASMLFASERTISNHIQHIFNKLDVSSSLEAVTKGIKLGHIQPNY